MFEIDAWRRPHKIGFFLVPNFSMIAFAAAMEPLRLANRAAGEDCYAWTLFSADGGPVACSNGTVVEVDSALVSAPAIATVLVCGGLDIHRHVDPGVLSWLRRLERRGVGVGALCTGTHMLARAGLLNGYRCTIHWENLVGFGSRSAW